MTSRLITTLGLLLSAMVIFLAPGMTHAQGLKLNTSHGTIYQSSQYLSRDSVRKLTIMKGHVQIIFNGQHLTSEKAIIYEASQEIEAEGDVVINSPTAYVEGDRVRLNYETGHGIIYNGFVRSGQVVFEGRIVRKIGPDEYEAEHAYYTTCTTCPPAWSFTGSRIRAQLGGYARIRNAVVELAHFPILWLPYLVVPLKSDRQTGVLIPTMEFSSTSGTAPALSFFWAISRSQDATFTAKNYSFRGFKGLLDYRYALSQTSAGEANMAFLQDRVFTGLDDIPAERKGQKFNRWFFSFQNQYDLPNGIVEKSKFNLVSDLRYPRDFPKEVGGIGDTALEDRVSLTRNRERSHSSLDVSHYRTLLQSNPLAANTPAVHRFPELRYSLMEQNIGHGFVARADINYVNFTREDVGYDDVVTREDVATNPGASLGDGSQCTDVRCIDRSRGTPTTQWGQGRFDANKDVIRTGQRLIFQPELSRPMRVGEMLDVLPVLTFRHTQYAFGVNAPKDVPFDSTPSRQYLQAKVTMRTRFSRVYQSEPAPTPSQAIAATALPAAPESPPKSTPKSQRKSQPTPTPTPLPPPPPPLPRAASYKHEIEPNFTLSTLPWINRTKHSFFGSENRISVFSTSAPLSNADFLSNRGVQFDYEDRIPNRNLATIGLNNRLIQKRWLSDTPEYRQIINFRLQQSFDIDEASKRSPPRYPWSEVTALLNVTTDPLETTAKVQYYPYHNATNTSASTRIKDRRGDYFEVRLEQQFAITEELDKDYAGRTETFGLGTGVVLPYLDLKASIDFLPERWTPLQLKAKQWSGDLVLHPPGDCWAIGVSVKQVIGDKPVYDSTFNLFYGGADRQGVMRRF